MRQQVTGKKSRLTETVSAQSDAIYSSDFSHQRALGVNRLLGRKVGSLRLCRLKLMLSAGLTLATRGLCASTGYWEEK